MTKYDIYNEICLNWSKSLTKNILNNDTIIIANNPTTNPGST